MNKKTEKNKRYKKNKIIEYNHKKRMYMFIILDYELSKFNDEDFKEVFDEIKRVIVNKRVLNNLRKEMNHE